MTATTTGATKLGLLEQLGADAVVMDGLDAASVASATASRWSVPSVRSRSGRASAAAEATDDKDTGAGIEQARFRFYSPNRP